MSARVIDASVAAKWFLPAKGEPFADRALLLLDQYSKGRIQFVVPDLFWAEFGNILWKAVRQQRCTKRAAEAAIASLKQRNLPTVSSIVLLHRAFEIATLFDRTVYDSLYIALAVETNSEVITADERLANAVAGHLPVRWLGLI